MNFEFDMTLEFNETSCLFFIYPGIFDDGYAVLDVRVEIENYIPAREPHYTRGTKDPRYYDDGNVMEADIRLFAEINYNEKELPTALVYQFDILEEVDKQGLEIIADNNLEFELARRQAK